MPASLKRSAKAVHPEGYGLFFNFLPATRNARLQKFNGAKILNSVSRLTSVKQFRVLNRTRVIVQDTNCIGSCQRMQYPRGNMTNFLSRSA